MGITKSKEKILLLIALIFGLASISLIWLGDPEYVYAITREDQEIETMTVIFYLIGFIMALVAFFSNRKLLVALIWAVIIFIFLGEETSWFQRIFNYSVPAIEDVNAQKEFNFHNLDIFQGGSVIEDGFSLSVLLKSQNLFRLGFFGYFLVVPLLMYIPKLKKIANKVGYVQPSKLFIIVLLVVFVLSFALAPMVEFNVKMSIAETREMLYSFFILIYVILYIWMTRFNFKK